jgi:hypothetical protein
MRIRIDIGISVSFDESGRKRPKLDRNLMRRYSVGLELRDKFPQSLYRLLLPFFARRVGLQPVQYERASTSLQVKPPFVGEDAVSLSDCIEVNAEIDRQLSHGRYLVARLELAVNEQVTQCVDNLAVSGH